MNRTSQEEPLGRQTMRAIATRAWRRIKAVLTRRLVIPWVCWRVPLGVILAIVVAGATGTGVVMHETSRPLFCLSCHEMGMPVNTWRVSTHEDVPCAKCHIMPGTISMFRSKVSALRQVYLHMRGPVESAAIRAHVPDANCKACHPQTRNLVVYHTIQITHKAHWDRDIKCTFCHDQLVHGPQPAFGNPPRMETCYKCHDGKQASNDCSLCHIVLGQRSPATFSPEWVEAHKENIRQHGQTCERCHRSDFCNNCHRTADPHPSNWLAEHPKGFRAKPQSCRVCHALPGETGELSFCRDCHALRRAHSLDWITIHPQKFKQDPKDCARCHQEKFCADCHAIYRHHPPDWLRTHPPQARARPQGCQVCHTEEYCRRCHQQTVPKSHNARWPVSHGAAVIGGEGGCEACHRPSFCQSCHSSQAGQPKSHDARWTISHGAVALANDQSCRTCHDQQFCSSCHGLPMPHPQGWIQAHRAAAKQQPKVCSRCHDQSFCVACHRSTVPTSHQQDWLQRHGAQARANPASCKACHTESLCQACHRGVKMPHPKDWPNTHGAQAKTPAAQQNCAACHPAAYCSKCHGLSMPHPDDWLEQHGAQAQQSSQLCLRCHGPQAGAAPQAKGKAATEAACTTCHEALEPSSHEAKDWLPEQHFVVGSEQPDLCTLCHGQNACDTCHAKRGVGGK